MPLSRATTGEIFLIRLVDRSIVITTVRARITKDKIIETGSNIWRNKRPVMVSIRLVKTGIKIKEKPIPIKHESMQIIIYGSEMLALI